MIQTIGKRSYSSPSKRFCIIPSAIRSAFAEVNLVSLVHVIKTIKIFSIDLFLTTSLKPRESEE